jgi:hypothetical protein
MVRNSRLAKGSAIMPGKKITVVIAQSPGKNPTKRHLEEELAATMLLEPDVDVSLVPHLYDLTPDHTGTLFLKSISGHMVVLAWLYPRAARWVLDRNGVKGKPGITLLPQEDATHDAPPGETAGPPPSEEEVRPNALGAWNVPQRRIYCIDLRVQSDPGVYVEEIRRICKECSVQTVELMSWINGNPPPEQLDRYLNPFRPAESGRAPAERTEPAAGSALAGAALATDEQLKRRWYPVIDYSRCTNCMECIDFCLFGVYGLDSGERILVEQQDNCKKGCPACSRVCPENAIIFPEHKTASIAGADVERTADGFKIDLSKLFGAPTALDMAVAERDAELVRDGRDAVGATVGMPKRRQNAPKTNDALDALMDDLDQLEL